MDMYVRTYVKCGGSGMSKIFSVMAENCEVFVKSLRKRMG